VGKIWRLALILTLLAVCVIGDQFSKALARARLVLGERISLAGGMVILEYSENVGAFLSLGARLPPTARFVLMTVIAGVLVLGMAIFLLSSPSLPVRETLALTFMVGGGIGNLIDRVRYDGAVADFMNVGIGTLRTGIFNVADVALTGGAIALALFGILDFVRARRAPTPELP